MYKIAIFLTLLSTALFGQKWAVIVGINKYINSKDIEFKNLTGAVNDAKAFRDILLKNGVNKNNIILLTDKNATKANIINSLKEIESKIKKGDMFYYYHSGHGTKPEGVEPKDYDGGFIVPTDYNNTFNTLIYTSKDLKPIFKKIDKKVEYALLVFDTCYSGQNFRGLLDKDTTIKKSLPPIKIDRKLLKKYQGYPYQHTFALTATDTSHIALEDRVKKRGIFTMAFESCIYNLGIAYPNSLDECLKRRYDRVFYFKTPPNSKKIPLFRLKSNKIDKIKILTSQKFNFLNQYALFVNGGYSDFELSFYNNQYRLTKNREFVATFNTKEALINYLSAFRVIKTKNSFNKDVKIEIKSNGETKDLYKIGNTIKIDIESNCKGYLAVISLDKSGSLYIIEPVDIFLEFNKNYSLSTKITEPAGVDFLKVMIFKAKNNLTDIKVDPKSGKVLEPNSIEDILSILRHSNFCENYTSIKSIKGD